MKEIIMREKLKYSKEKDEKTLKENEAIRAVFYKALREGNCTKEEEKELIYFLNGLKNIREELEDDIEAIKDLLDLDIIYICTTD